MKSKFFQRVDRLDKLCQKINMNKPVVGYTQLYAYSWIFILQKLILFNNTTQMKWQMMQ